MGNYSESPSMVRVDFFKLSGKWYMTEAWDMRDYYNITGIHEAIALMLDQTDRGRRLRKQFIIVILDPYHKNSHPVMMHPEHLEQRIIDLSNMTKDIL